MYRNLTDAFIDVVTRITNDGSTVHARGQGQKELLSQLLRITSPQERIMIVPLRNGNVFAQVAETLWVLDGRNDLDYLTRYLPRAKDFSDDGTTWRAGYGPRIRRWNGEIDQLTAVRDRILEDRNTKRAVISIYDPGSDFSNTLDVPCNNWLHFIRRGIDLHLNVAVRANDAFWGFSGINFFEWSVLHELMANVTGSTVGHINWFVGSLHVYERHYSKAWQIAESVRRTSVYDLGVPPLRVTSTEIERFDEDLDRVLEAESVARTGSYQHAIDIVESVADDFLRDSGFMLLAYNQFLDGSAATAVTETIQRMRPSDVRTAGVEYLMRRWKRTDPDTLDLALSAGESSFLRLHFDAVARIEHGPLNVPPSLAGAS